MCFAHLLTTARLHTVDRFDRLTDSVVMNPACQLPKFFEAQPTADSASYIHQCIGWETVDMWWAPKPSLIARRLSSRTMIRSTSRGITSRVWTSSQTLPKKRTSALGERTNRGILKANEHAELKKIIHRTRPMRPLDPAELARRFSDCFEASPTFTGKIKFFNCGSGVNGGASFAKPAAGLLRAYFPDALYIAYEDDLLQAYGNYYPDGPSTRDSEEPKTERRKLGATTHKRAKDLQVILREEESEEGSDSTEEPLAYLVPDLDDLRAAARGLNFDLNNFNIQEFHL